MELFYQGVNITDSVQVAACTIRDVSGGRTDCAEITFQQSENWYHWKPKADDVIEIVHNGVITGKLYFNAASPEADQFGVLATAAKNAARRVANGSYADKTLEDIARILAAEIGMGFRIFGIDGKIHYPYLQRENEGAAAFLQRVAAWEGAVLKTYSGRLTVIGIAAAQELPAAETIHISAKQDGVLYQRRENAKLKHLTVVTPYAEVTATDTGAKMQDLESKISLPAVDAATAGRWARGQLLCINRKAETLEISSDLHMNWTAMLRVDVTGDTDASGEWLIDEVTHDLINNTSKAKLLRCVKTIK